MCASGQGCVKSRGGDAWRWAVPAPFACDIIERARIGIRQREWAVRFGRELRLDPIESTHLIAQLFVARVKKRLQVATPVVFSAGGARAREMDECVRRRSEYA